MKKPPGSGTFWAWLKHEHVDWSTNAHSYEWSEVGGNGVTAHVRKTSDQRVRVVVSGLPGGDRAFKPHPVPKCDSRGMFVAVRWDPTGVSLLLGGVEPAEEVEVISNPAS